jgi:hypothetical protein
MLLSSCDDPPTIKPQSTPTATTREHEGTVAKRVTSTGQKNDQFVLSEGGPDASLRPPLRERVGGALQGPRIHQAVAKAQDDIGKSLAQFLTDKTGASRFITSKWAEMASALPRKPLPSATNETVKVGAIMPKEGEAVIVRSEPYVEQLMAGEHPAFTTDAALASAGAIQLLGIGMGDDLGTALSKHADELPPTEADLVILSAALTGISLHGPNMTTAQEWSELASARNPIYRFLALRAARQGNWGDNRTDGRLAFASYYENETDPTIILELVQMLGTVPSPQSRSRLEALKLKAMNANDNRLSAEIEQALRSHELLTAAGASTR